MFLVFKKIKFNILYDTKIDLINFNNIAFWSTIES